MVRDISENIDGIYKKYGFYQCFQGRHGPYRKNRIGPAEPFTILYFAIFMYGTVPYKCTVSKNEREKSRRKNKKSFF